MTLSPVIFNTINEAVQAALVSPDFDPEETVFEIITQVLGHEPDFELYETLSMEMNLA